MMAKRITITIESTSLEILHGQISGGAECDRCAAEIEVIAIDATAASNPRREMQKHRSSSKKLLPSSHYSPLASLKSLLARMRRPKIR